MFLFVFLCTSISQVWELSSACIKEMFLERLTEATYDVDILRDAFGLEESDDVTKSTYARLFDHFHKFFSDCLDDDFNEDRLVAHIAATPLEALSDRFLATALRRLSETHGLPSDGHVLHTVIQGKAAFMHFGPDRKVKVRPLQETESEWQMASHRGSVFLVGDSAAGKDIVLKILAILDEGIQRQTWFQYP